MDTVKQISLEEWAETQGRWCHSHRCYNCQAHTGRRGYGWLPGEIIRAMQEHARERREMGHRIEPLYPHDVWVYMEGELPHIQTMRKYMKQLAETLKLVRVGVRGGYLLPEYAHVGKSGHPN